MGLSERKVKRQLVGSAVTSNAAWTANGALPGQRMLASMGWSQGQGLGVNQQGSAAPISVAFKLDNKGLGVIRAEKEARKAGNTSSDWLGGGSDYEALLQRLNAANSQPASPSANIEEEATVEEAVTTVDSQKEKKKKKSKKRKSSEDDDASDNEAWTADDSSKKKRKKSKKEEGKRKDADNTDSSSPEPAAILTTVAVATVTKPAAPHRLAHRAKFLRAKGLLGPDSRSSPVSGSSTPIPQSPSPAPASPAPVSENVPADQADDAEISLKKKKEKKKSKQGKSKADDDEQQQAGAEEVTVTVEATVVTQSTNGELSDKARRKAEKAAAKEAKKAAKKAAKLAGAPVIEPPESEESETPPIAAKESPKPIITDPFDDPVEPPPSQLSVQAYLANKLIRRKAEVARAKRETEQAMWARAAGATAASS
ncbi:hypothetical protein OC845_002931 [Tilletia horrida]|nr:hypothetical protein OC845_002931 [Tilletia horrida]